MKDTWKFKKKADTLLIPLKLLQELLREIEKDLALSEQREKKRIFLFRNVLLTAL